MRWGGTIDAYGLGASRVRVEAGRVRVGVVVHDARCQGMGGGCMVVYVSSGSVGVRVCVLYEVQDRRDDWRMLSGRG